MLTANVRIKILDFGGLDSSRILILRGGILRSVGNLPESLSQGILLGIILVGRLGVSEGRARRHVLPRAIPTPLRAEQKGSPHTLN